jgi:hypothetical protein
MGLLWRKHLAIFFDDKGEYLDVCKLKRSQDTFKYGSGKEQRQFNIILDNCTTFNRKGLLFDKRYYFYNINNPMPLILNKRCEPVFNSKLYNVMMETNVAQQLNDLAKDSFAKYLTPRNIIIAIIIIGVIIYFASGGTLKGGTDVVPVT